MSAGTGLNIDFCRQQFPALKSGWVFMENAGGTLVPQQVIDRTSRFMTDCQVQPGSGYAPSIEGAARIEEGLEGLASLINADSDEIIVGPSTTSNVYVLSHALSPLLEAGDEIIVTNQDHEANNGAWRALRSRGLVIREWCMNEDTDDLEIDDLAVLLNEKTKLVCFTHCSNIVGLIHDVGTIVRTIHDAGALVCVDGVAFAPHRRVDVKELDVDFYLFSPYKVFGPHMGVLYGKRDLMALLASQSHYFLTSNDFQRRFCPGGPNYELSAASAGILDYLDLVHARHFPGSNSNRQERLDQVFDLFSRHETALVRRLDEFLASKPGVRLAGAGATPDRERVGVFSFTVTGRDSREIPEALRCLQIGVHADDFYAARCIDALGARSQNGVIRVSLVHYNSAEDVDRVIDGLESVL